MKHLCTVFRKYTHIILLAFFATAVFTSGVLIFANAHQDVVLNEVCTSNVSCCEDASGNYPDWIEIYNPTGEDIDLSGYIVNKSTDLKKEKFIVPEGTIIAPGAFYLFDPLFTISSEGGTINLVDRDMNYIDRITVPKLQYDTTYARISDADLSWQRMTPTPGYSNSDGEELPEVIEGSVLASADPGFYEDEFDLKLSSTNWGRKIYYTLDGSDPKSEGVLYEGPVHIYDRSKDANKWSMIPQTSVEYVEGRAKLPSYAIDKCTVVRAVAADRLGRFTDECTYTYFVGFDKKDAYDGITVVSAIVDPADLYDHDSGIMVLGSDYDAYVAAGEPDEYEGNTANFTRRGRKSERGADIEIFDSDHENVLDTKAGIRIKGLSSRWDVQKSFGVIFRQAYGGNYRESFSTDGVNFDLHSFSVDKCGQDNETKMIDVIMEKCMQDSGCATVRRVPAALFLNGEYWGFYWLSERLDRSFLSDRYDVSKDDVEYRDKDDFDWPGAWNVDNFDRESLINYYAGNIIVAHETDWPDFNVRFWRTLSDEGSTYGDGKFRPVIYDMNSDSMRYPDFDSFSYLMECFYPFMEITEDDENFRSDLCERILLMNEGCFEKENVGHLIDNISRHIEKQMVLDKMRYSDCSADEAKRSFNDNVDVIRKFYEERGAYIERFMARYLEDK